MIASIFGRDGDKAPVNGALDRNKVRTVTMLQREVTVPRRTDTSPFAVFVLKSKVVRFEAFNSLSVISYLFYN
jgi:hypothetical protein